MQVVAGVDVGGTRIKGALVDRSLAVLAQTTEPTPPDIGQDIGAVLDATVRGLLETRRDDGRELELVGCGLVVPGLVDEASGTGLLSLNLGWRDLPIRDAVSSALGVRTVVGHDVRAGLLAESRIGAARGARDVVFLPVGTGIAGALMLDGSVISAGGRAGELGHVTVDPSGPLCPCGRTGCLEVVASAAAIARRYAGLSGRWVDAETVARLATEGDLAALGVWSRAVDALAQVIVTTVTITGVDLVLVGGGLAESGTALLDPLRQHVSSWPTLQHPPRVERASLGDRAGCVGAAVLAWDAS